MKEYIRRVKQTVEESWLDPAEEAGSSKAVQETPATTAATVPAVTAA